MINHQLVRVDQIKSLKLDDESKYGSFNFAGQTIDVKLADDKIKRITFGINKLSYTNLVAITWEILQNYHEEDYIAKKLDQAAYENGYGFWW